MNNNISWSKVAQRIRNQFCYYTENKTTSILADDIEQAAIKVLSDLQLPEKNNYWNNDIYKGWNMSQDAWRKALEEPYVKKEAETIHKDSICKDKGDSVTYHELTNILFNPQACTKQWADEIDKLIRDWLEEKAKYISFNFGNGVEIRKVLGLTETVKSEPYWCEHASKTDKGFVFVDWELIVGPVKNENAKYCAICGTPRPDSKDVKEEGILSLAMKAQDNFQPSEPDVELPEKVTCLTNFGEWEKSVSRAINGLIDWLAKYGKNNNS